MKPSVLFLLLILTAGLSWAEGAREEESFSYTGIDRIEIQGVFLNVEVDGGGGSSVSMRSDLPEDTFFDPRNFTVKNAKSGSTLRVWVEKDPGVLSGRGEGTLFFRVPRETSLSVETASGDIRISGLDSWELEIGSASGDVLLDDINNPFHVKTVSGDIDARRIRADSSLSTVSGDIEIVDVVGKVVAESVSGHITGTRIRLTADSLFKSISGDIRIDLDNALDSLRYDLSTVSGGLTVGSVRAARGLQMGNGDLTLRGDTVSGSQSYR